MFNRLCVYECAFLLLIPQIPTATGALTVTAGSDLPSIVYSNG